MDKLTDYVDYYRLCTNNAYFFIRSNSETEKMLISINQLFKAQKKGAEYKRIAIKRRIEIIRLRKRYIKVTWVLFASVVVMVAADIFMFYNYL